MVETIGAAMQKTDAHPFCFHGLTGSDFLDIIFNI